MTTLRLAMLSLVTLTAAQAQDPAALAQLRSQRRELAHQPRRIVFNNDGCDALYYPHDAEFKVQTFLDARTTALAGTQVDAISYCTISSGFGQFTHHTKAGAVLTRQSADYGIQPTKRNITEELIAAGTDSLRAVLEYGHAHGMEVWWSMRMNDTHDAAHRPDKPYLLYPELKVQHPEWLIGEWDKRTPHGRWSSVDYAVPEIRDLALSYLTEVAENYDVDALELDYFRHLTYFRSVANGGVASDEERAMLTDFMRQVRAMTEAVGLKRGRPLLVAIRVPDSVGFCRDMGFDLETWLADGLVDALITTCYFRLNPWSYSVDLGHKYGVVVYPCLSDSRMQGETRFRRSSIESYRARAANAWAAGADGIHLFNYFNPNGPPFRELGDPTGLKTMDKFYFVNCRDGNPRSWMANGPDYQTIPMLAPSSTKTITPDEPLRIPLTVNEDLTLTPAPAITLHVELPSVDDSAQVTASINGHKLPRGTLTKGWLDIPVERGFLVAGDNQVEVALDASATPDPKAWAIRYEGGELPKLPWVKDRGSANTVVEPADGALRIGDRGTDSGDYQYIRYGWGIQPGQRWEIEVEVKVVSGSNYIIVNDGRAHERIGLFPDHVELWSEKAKRFDIDLTDRFHTVRVACENGDLTVTMDGQPAISAPGKFVGKPGTQAGNDFSFGASNSPTLGEALWRAVKARPANPVCRDLMLSVKYAK